MGPLLSLFNLSSLSLSVSLLVSLCVYTVSEISEKEVYPGRGKSELIEMTQAAATTGELKKREKAEKVRDIAFRAGTVISLSLAIATSLLSLPSFTLLQLSHQWWSFLRFHWFCPLWFVLYVLSLRIIVVILFIFFLSLSLFFFSSLPLVLFFLLLHW